MAFEVTILIAPVLLFTHPYRVVTAGCLSALRAAFRWAAAGKMQLTAKSKSIAMRDIFLLVIWRSGEVFDRVGTVIA
jgi:hypothetical protein